MVSSPRGPVRLCSPCSPPETSGTSDVGFGEHDRLEAVLDLGDRVQGLAVAVLHGLLGRLGLHHVGGRGLDLLVEVDRGAEQHDDHRGDQERDELAHVDFSS
jgi:hypothetical protein